jgi:hypothetical protein
VDISSDEYRAKALELLVQASRAADGAIRNELLNLAVSYVRLADHVERAANNSGRESRSQNW